MTLHYSRLNLPFLETHTIQANIPWSIVTAFFFPISLYSRIIQLFILTYNTLPSVPARIFDDLWQSASLKVAKVHFSRGRAANPPWPPSLRGGWEGTWIYSLCVPDEIRHWRQIHIPELLLGACCNLIKAPHLHPKLLSSPRPLSWELMLPIPQSRREQELTLLKCKKFLPPSRFRPSCRDPKPSITPSKALCDTDWWLSPYHESRVGTAKPQDLRREQTEHITSTAW